MNNGFFEVGDRVRFKHMPATYPTATVVEVTPLSIRCRLDVTITEMGYEQEKQELDMNDPKHQPKLRKEIVIFNKSDIEVI